ncbi:MAG TPA: MiaB/RimO family radical SAM methylthiotransferase [Bacteroides sp.]|nr:MiaB/RimO family radical SAM methylthiotransferase [Bacteroides sp.]
MKYHLVTLGCQMNKSDSERTMTVIERLGYRWTASEDEADLLGILACSVRQKSIDKVYSRISKWNKSKKDRNLLTFVSGCILPADRGKFLKLFDLVFTMDELPDLGSMIRQYGVVTPVSLQSQYPTGLASLDEGQDTPLDLVTVLKDNKIDIPSDPGLLTLKKDPSEIKKFWKVDPHYTSDFEAFIPIQNGCDKFCTFCAVPYTRGREISRPSSEILDELRDLVERGYRSITLLGQNVNSYGHDKQGDEIPFHELLAKIGEYGDSSGKDFWVYFTSPHPRDMSNEVIDVIARYKCLAKQIHLPVQSGDDKVLITMNRNHNIDRYRNIVQYIRRTIPTATLFTDIIVGFTGETDEQFENTRLLMEEFRFNMAYIAMYSPRPGATSSRWEDNIPQETKKQRLQVLTDELIKHNRDYNRALIGKKTQVLVVGQDRKKGYLKALTEGKLIVRFPSTDKSLIGQYTEVKINSAADFSLEGENLAIIEQLNEQ